MNGEQPLTLEQELLVLQVQRDAYRNLVAVLRVEAENAILSHHARLAFGDHVLRRIDTQLLCERLPPLSSQPSAASAGAEASGGAGEVIGNDTPERILYESVVLDEDTGLPLAEIEVLAWKDGRRTVDAVLLGVAVLDLAEDQAEADVGQGFSPGAARAFGQQLMAAAEVAGVVPMAGPAVPTA